MSKVIIISAPSGSGKSTIISYLMEQLPELSFSISATSRPPRGEEKNGVEYYFLSSQEFSQRIATGDFLEYNEVYPGRFYGTLKCEVDKLLEEGKSVVCDVDVEGAENIKRVYGDRSLSVFIQPPSIQELQNRLEKRGTDSEEVIKDRIARAAYELTFSEKFDVVVINDNLSEARTEALTCIRDFIQK